MASSINAPPESLGLKKSFLRIALAVAYFHAAYTSLRSPAAGLLMIGYAFALVKLLDVLSL
jgi:hypothetical protein